MSDYNGSPTSRNSPVAPATTGTHSFLPSLNVTYTAGRDFVVPKLVDTLERTKTLACDIETYGLGVAATQLKCVTFADADTAVVLDPRDPYQANAILHLFDHLDHVVFHNSPFDVPHLVRNGLMRLHHIPKVLDTLIYARLAEPDEKAQKGLEAAGERHLGLSRSDKGMLAAFKAMGLTKSEGYHRFDIDRPVYLMGAAKDGIVTARLLPKVRADAYARLTFGHPFTDNGVTGDEAWRLVEREQGINHTMLKRAAVGMRVDFEFLDQYIQATSQDQHKRELALAELGIRPKVGQDLAKWLDGIGQLPADHPRTKTGLASTQAKHLDALSHPVARTFVEHKKTAKVLDDYLTKVTALADEHGRVHPQVGILAAVTGRMSAGDPPVHQFPGPARGILLADPGDALVSIDWSQVEPVVTANVAGELGVLESYEAGTADIYEAVGKLAGVDRKTSKTTLLAQLYGEGLDKLAADLGITADAAKDIKLGIFQSMPKVRNLLFKLRDIAAAHRVVFTVSGRILPIPMGVWNGERSVATHKGVNYFVQGSAYDLLAESLVTVAERGLGDGVYLAMHDELVVSESIAHEVTQIMKVPPARLCKLARRTPVLRTDTAVLGERWAAT